MLSRVLKDNNVVMDNHCLTLDKVKISEDKLGLKIVTNDKALQKDNEILLQARIKAHKMIENAEEKINRMMLDATKKIKEELDQARKTGREQGFAAGKTEAKEEIRLAADELMQLISSIEAEKKAVFSGYENGLKDLSLAIAHKIIDAELKKNEELFLSIYAKAVKEYNEEDWVKITISEFEADFVTTNAELLLSMTKGAKDIKIEVLQNAPRGTCIIETPLSVIDASVSIQLRKLEESFANIGMSV